MKIWRIKINVLPLQSLLRTKRRAFSSAGLEHLPYKQRVGGSNPSTPTVLKDFISIEIESFFCFIIVSLIRFKREVKYFFPLIFRWLSRESRMRNSFCLKIKVLLIKIKKCSFKIKSYTIESSCFFKFFSSSRKLIIISKISALLSTFFLFSFSIFLAAASLNPRTLTRL